MKKCTKDSSKQRDHRVCRIYKYILVRFWLQIVEFWSEFGQIILLILGGNFMLLIIGLIFEGAYIRDFTVCCSKKVEIKGPFTIKDLKNFYGLSFD